VVYALFVAWSIIAYTLISNKLSNLLRKYSQAYQQMGFVERYLNRHILFEIAPGIIFFIVNYAWNLMVATAAVIIATLVFTVMGFLIERRIPVFPIVTVLLVLLLGGATLIFEDELFIKIKPTIGNFLFALILLSGLLFRPACWPEH
jgi:hypothetical protein